MTSAGDPYLPNLEGCFAGRVTVLSWTHILAQLIRESIHDSPSNALTFLTSPHATRILSLAQILEVPVPKLLKPSPHARAEYESKTAAINITSSPGAPYSLDEIKADTEWLSSLLKLDEIECLRITLLEWQMRPVAQLRDGLSETEAASLRDALGSEDYGLGRSDSPASGNLASPAFRSKEERRTRLLALCMQEQSSLFQVSAVLTDAVLQPEVPFEQRSDHTLGQIKSVVENHSLRSTNGLAACFDSLKDCLSRFSNGPAWAGDSFDTTEMLEEWTRSLLNQVCALIELILNHCISPGTHMDVQHILKWLELMFEVNFFLAFEPQSARQASLCSKIQALASTCTLAFLHLSEATEYIEQIRASPEVQFDTSVSAPYFMDPEVAADIHQMMISFVDRSIVQAAPAMLAWGLILGNIREAAATSKESREATHVQKALDYGSRESSSGRRLSSSSVGSIQQSPSEDVIDSIRLVSRGEDDVDALNHAAAVTSNVFRYIVHLSSSEMSRTTVAVVAQARIFQQLIITSIAQMGYTEDIVAAQLAVIDALADSVPESRGDGDAYLLQVREFHEESGVRDVLELAASRFPHETLPFLQLCNSLARLGYVDDDGNDYVAAFLQELPTFTQMVNPDFTAYQTIREHMNANLVSLDADVDMLGITNPQRLLDAGGEATELCNTIPSGAVGEVVSEGKPPVIKWQHSYSGFAYMGYWLNSFRCGYLQATYQDQDHLEDIAAVMFEILSRLLSGKHLGFAAKLAYTSSLLADIANGLPEDTDMASILFDICEQQMQSLRYRKQSTRGCNVVVACVKLIMMLLPLLPNRIWSLLSRSALIDSRSTSGGVFPIILSIEAVHEKYDFLEAYCDLYRIMVEESLRQAVGNNSASTFGRTAVSDQSVRESVPTRIMRTVLQASTRTVMDSFQAASRWKFALPNQKLHIATNLSETFQTILECTYGVDDNANLSGKLTAALAPSAMYIADVLRPHVEEASEACCLLRWLLVSWQYSVPSASLIVASKLSKQVCAIMSLVQVTLSVGVLLSSTPSALESQILDSLPVSIRLGALDTNCTFEMLAMLQALLRTMPADNAPSLLGRLGSASARAFVESLLPSIRQSGSSLLRVKVWDVFTSLVTHSQQWFAMVLLQGCSPDFQNRKSHLTCSSKEEPTLRGRPVLAEAIDYVVAIDRQSLKVAASVLSFVVNSQRHWSWVTDSVQTHPELLRSLITFVNNMSSEDSHSPVQSQSNKIAALIIELATVQLHFARTKKDKTMIQKMVPLMRWATENAISVDGYNVSLHSSLRKNFSARYDTVTLANFKRTQLYEKPYGDDFYYGIELAEKMLSHRGVDVRRPDFDKTFRQEFVRVNVNLSLVDSQMRLLDSFQSFCVENCIFISQNLEVQKIMANIVQNLLVANTTSPPSERIFETLFQTRADLALVIARSLTEIKSPGPECSNLLTAAWNALRFRNPTYEFAIDNDDLYYFRTTLTTVLLAMQFHAEKREINPDKLDLVSTVRDPSSSIIIEIASVVVADGLKSVVSCIHDQATNARNKESSTDTFIDAKDVASILAILQAILRLHILPQIASQLAIGFVSSNILQSCILLYSWSHTLTHPSTDHDPIYADLSLRFLVSLSTLPQAAEEFAVEGVVSRISTARITQLLRAVKGGASQFDTRPHIAALYRVWTAGILPLCLNLLHSVGRTMAGDVAGFLNQFPAQLARAARAFRFHGGSGEPLTLVRANEGAVLALISRILAEYRLAGASAGVDAYDVPMLEGYDEERGAILDDVREIYVGGKVKVAIVPVTEKERLWQRMTGGADEKSRLETGIVMELRNVLACLDGAPGR